MSYSVVMNNTRHGFGNVMSLMDKIEGKYLFQQRPLDSSFEGMIGNENALRDVFEQIQRVAPYDYPVHISGETGTGKELTARAIHNLSAINKGPFVAINCGALPEGLIESELFGHVKGSFTGAIRDKKGRFELAEGGTLFLDEVAELSKLMQVKLLRFLQDGVIERVGSEKPIQLKVRVISATNKNLKGETQKGNFRDDLFYRLNVIPIRLPALRERKGDIPLLTDYFLSEEAARCQTRKLEISEKAMTMLESYQWPGNVRELQNTVHFTIVRSKDGLITSACLPAEFWQVEEPEKKRSSARKLDLDSVEKTLQLTGGNKSRAAKKLGVGRATLYRFIDDNPLMCEHSA